jgi:hypothetical protein
MFTKDLLERAARTFVQAALAVLASDLMGLTDVDTAKTLGVAAISAGLSAVMSLLAMNVGPSGSASVVVPEQVIVANPEPQVEVDPEDQLPLPGAEWE